MLEWALASPRRARRHVHDGLPPPPPPHPLPPHPHPHPPRGLPLAYLSHVADRLSYVGYVHVDNGFPRPRGDRPIDQAVGGVAKKVPRGNLLSWPVLSPNVRSIPAWAGEPSSLNAISIPASVYPRVGGGTLIAQGGKWLAQGLSPRGRGNHIRRRRILGRERSIPAWAGEPTHQAFLWAVSMVYPRVGGGTVVDRPIRLDQPGLSPRGRGNQCGGCRAGSNEGSIPAWAGEPQRT